ncbi:MAG: VWA domain-containing protein [Gammaproteobacteria bacterium]|nr:VWA domain-containing protein [Gammaproteobacteria bacterium]
MAGEVYRLLEAAAADHALLHLLPGMGPAIDELRQAALGSRPPMDSFPGHARPLETFLRGLIGREYDRWSHLVRDAASPAETADAAMAIARELYGEEAHRTGPRRLMPDWWVGELLAPPAPAGRETIDSPGAGEDEDAAAPRTSRMRRRPDVRKAAEDEDDDENKSGPWMVQADDPHQKAEDPMGLTRPTDRGDEDAAELGDMLSDIPAARLVSTPGRPKEVLLSDDPPDARAHRRDAATPDGEWRVQYPEWDYRAAAYRMPGATVQVSAPQAGSQAWVDATLEAHRAMLQSIRRRFEMLQARRVVLRRQQDGDDIDLESCVDAIADLRAGSHMTEGLYRTTRANDRQMAIVLLIDVSGSTDGWISANRRIIDVEREALLLVGIALRELGEPFAIQAFSGEGPNRVTVRSIKTFEERFDNDTALRIAALEPEHYTRAGAALRHAAAGLMQQPADHRLLLLLSDGKPNDVDLYEGRYGVEDMHQAVTEARLQGIFPFCLTIDRQAANYLPRIFGANQYAMLPKPELLPSVLLDWMRRLLRD